MGGEVVVRRSSNEKILTLPFQVSKSLSFFPSLTHSLALFLSPRSPRLRWSISLAMVHGYIPIDQEALAQADDFHTYIERNGHQRVEHDNIGKEVESRNGVWIIGNEAGPLEINRKVLHKMGKKDVKKVCACACE